jgi:hypothetical protein
MKFHADCSVCQGSSNVDATNFTLVCLWVDLRQFLVRQEHHSLENLNALKQKHRV